MFGLVTSAFAAEEETAENKSVSTDVSDASDAGMPASIEQTEQTRALITVNTGTISAGSYAVVYSKNPLLTQTWMIGRQSGSSGKIDVEVRNELGVVLGYFWCIIRPGAGFVPAPYLFQGKFQAK